MKFRKKLFLILILLISINSISYADELRLNATSAILVEVSTGKVLYERNSNEKRYPASITKIMTAILVLENCNLSDKTIVTKEALSNIPSRICYM